MNVEGGRESLIPDRGVEVPFKFKRLVGVGWVQPRNATIHIRASDNSAQWSVSFGFDRDCQTIRPYRNSRDQYVCQEGWHLARKKVLRGSG